MVANDVGVGFVPLMCVERELFRRELIVAPIEDFHLERNIWVVWPSSDVHSHAALAFMRVVNSLAKKHEQNPADDSSRSSAADVVNLKTHKHALHSQM